MHRSHHGHPRRAGGRPVRAGEEEHGPEVSRVEQPARDRRAGDARVRRGRPLGRRRPLHDARDEAELLTSTHAFFFRIR